jgi:hypothetical protein
MRGRTPVSALNAIVSSESTDVPLNQPAIVLPLSSDIAFTGSGSCGAYGDGVAGLRAAVAQRVERRDAGAQERTRVRRVDRIGNARDGLGRRDHELRVRQTWKVRIGRYRSCARAPSR